MRATSTSPLALAAAGTAPRASDAGPANAEELCERYAHRIYRFAAMVARGDVEAEDLAHDALIKAIRGLALYDSTRGSVEAWLRRIVVNAARDAGLTARRRFALLSRLRSEAASAPVSAPAPLVRDDQLMKAIRDLKPPRPSGRRSSLRRRPRLRGCRHCVGDLNRGGGCRHAPCAVPPPHHSGEPR